MINEIRAVLQKHKDHIPVVATAELLAVMEDSCEWKPHGKYGWIIVPPHKEGSARNKDDLQNRPYCAVCGNKIKIAK